MRVLGIDFGTKRVGLATSDPDQRIATPIATVALAEAIEYIVQYAQQHTAYRLVIGDPIGLDGKPTDATAPMRAFVAELQAAYPHFRISYIDERFSSKIAHDALKRGTKKQRNKPGIKDQMAATLILQSYLERYVPQRYDIQLYGQPILRQPTQPIQHIDTPETQWLIENMFATMYHAKGIGLAAPQIGHNSQLFVIGVPIETQGQKNLYEGVFINPELQPEDAPLVTYEEGCLSLPDIRAAVTRPDRIRIRYQNACAQHCEDTFDGLTARVIQHEYDHLHGKLFIDYLSPLKRRLLKKKLKRLESLHLSL